MMRWAGHVANAQYAWFWSILCCFTRINFKCFKIKCYDKFPGARKMSWLGKWTSLSICGKELVCEDSFSTYKSPLKSSWTGGNVPLLWRRRHNSITAVHCCQSTNFSNGPTWCQNTEKQSVPLCYYNSDFMNQYSHRFPSTVIMELLNLKVKRISDGRHTCEIQNLWVIQNNM